MPGYLIDGLTVTGQIGAGLTLLDRILCVGEVLVDAGGFTDRSALARREDHATPFALLTGTSDAVYVGYDGTSQAPGDVIAATQLGFKGIRIRLATAGAGVTLAVTYWNGTAWTAVAGLVDGTSGLTQDGALTWTRPSDWVPNSVNGGPTMYHVQLTTTSTPSTAPEALTVVVGWTIYDAAAGTNAKVYTTLGEDDASPQYLWVNDNSPNSSARFMAWVQYESWNPSTHTGSGLTPTAAQLAAGGIVEKSNTADATARPVTALVSRDTILLAVAATATALTGTANDAGLYTTGRFVSYVAGDGFNVVVVTAATLSSTGERFAVVLGQGVLGTVVGHYVQRPASGAGASTALGATGLLTPSTSTTAFLAYPNPANGAIVLHPIYLTEGTATGTLRGHLAGVMALPHVDAAGFLAGNVFTDPESGAQYWILPTGPGNVSVLAPWVGLEVPA